MKSKRAQVQELSIEGRVLSSSIHLYPKPFTLERSKVMKVVKKYQKLLVISQRNLVLLIIQAPKQHLGTKGR